MLTRLQKWALTLLSCALLAGALMLATFCPLTYAQDEADEAPMLTIGSKAPALDIEHWVSDGNGKFKPVTQFEPGKVYVVEFWATWCGPCISSMPHLVETQHKYQDSDVQIISISSEDLETVEEFLQRKVPGAKENEEIAEEDADTEKVDEPQPKTYAALTSAYCLTTDPDRSVSNDYMRAAGQNGIPCCFIVGKQGVIEWIGHPMSMDNALAAVVNDKWDRDAFLAEFKKSQERQILMSKITRLARSGDVEAALKAIEEARAAAVDDPSALATLDRIELTVTLSPILAQIKSGDTDAAIAAIDQLIEVAPPAKKTQLISVKFSVLMQSGDQASAAMALKELAELENVDPQMLNQIAWNIYEAAKSDKSFSTELIVAATEVAEKAVSLGPENGPILDTLAHLVHLQGDLDKAIELQTKAVENAGSSSAAIKAFLDQLKTEKADP